MGENNGPLYPDVTVQLSGQDGNAFFIIGRTRAALRDARVPDETIRRFTAEAESGDYNHCAANGDEVGGYAMSDGYLIPADVLRYVLRNGSGDDEVNQMIRDELARREEADDVRAVPECADVESAR